MKTSSCKGKGRRHQQRLRDDLRVVGRAFGLVEDDIVSTAMGQNGVDIQFSPAAAKVFPLNIEAKNVEKLSVVPTFWEHFNKYKDNGRLSILVHTKNRSEPLVTFRWADFLKMLEVRSFKS